MPEIDITISSDLKQMFELPACHDIKLPKPEGLNIQLPTGGSLKSIADVSKGIPTDCSATFNILIQLAPFMASIECLVRVLGLLKPLIEVIKGLPFPPMQAINDFIKAATDLAPCLAVPTPAIMIPFVRDILCLILKVLKCFVGQLKSIAEIMGGLSIQLQAAEEAGNTELKQILMCAQENAATSAQHASEAMEPVMNIMDTMGVFLGLAGVDPIKITGVTSATDLESLNKTVAALEAVTDTIQTVVDSPPIGGCPA